MTRWDAVIAAVTLGLGGDRDAGRHALTACWQGTAETDHAQRCVVAHYLADLQPELADEVAWDERALSAYRHVAEGELAPVGIPSASGLAPSLHLNLGDGYLRLGRLGAAAEQAEAGLLAQDALADDDYGAHVRGGLARLARRIAAAQAAVPPER